MTSANLAGIINFETWTLADPGSTIDITLNDANAASGQTLFIDGSAMSSDTQLLLDVSNETDGTIDVTGGGVPEIITVNSTAAVLGAVNLGSGTDKIQSTGGMNLSGATLSGVETVRVDSDSDDSGTTTLTVNSSTDFGGAAIETAEFTPHLHIASDDGMNLSGMSLFNGATTGSTHSILIDSSGDGAETLTVSSSTDFTGTTSSKTIEIREQEGGSGGSNNETIASADGINFGDSGSTIELTGISNINFDTDNSGTSNFEIRSNTVLGSATINGGTDGNDEIQLNGGTTFDLSSNAITNVSQITGDGSTNTLTLGTSIPSGLIIDLAGGTDVLNLGNTTNTVTVSNTETVVGGTVADTISATQANISGNSFDGGTGADVLNITDAGSTLNATTLANVINFETWNMTGLGSSVGMLTNDANVAAGQTLAINFLSSSAQFSFSGAAETDGSFNITSDAGNDFITGGANTLEGGGGNDILTGGADDDEITGGDGADTLNGGAGGDTLTGGDGADAINAGAADAASDTLIYNATSEYGDTITNFNAGASNNDLFDFAASIVSALSGTGEFEAVASGGSIDTANTDLVVYTTNADLTSATTVASSLNGIADHGADLSRMYVVGDGTDSQIWSWSDTDSGGDIDAGELELIANLTGVDQGNVNQLNFADFSEGFG